MSADSLPDVHTDLQLAFNMAPVGLLVSRHRVIQSCNETFLNMFGYALDALVGESLACLYPSLAEFKHVGDRASTVMKEQFLYSDERIMRRADARLFWCHVSGRAIERDDPFAVAVWVFEDISAKRPVTTKLTTREREVAQFLAAGKSSKDIARQLGVSYRTVDAHRARLIQKFGVASSRELITRLLGHG